MASKGVTRSMSRESPDNVKHEADEDSDPPSHILSLPDEVLLAIGQFLNLQDLIQLTQANKRLYKAFHTHSKTWEKFFKEFCLTRSSFIEEAVAGII